MKADVCRSCGARIIWAVTVNGKTAPIDAEPVPDGNLWLVKGLTAPVAITAGEHATPSRYKNHFATCPHAESHKKG